MLLATLLVTLTVKAQEKTERRKNIIELTKISKHTLIVLTLIETDDGRSLVVFDPFSKKTISRRIGENFIKLADLLSKDERFLVLPKGFSEEFEVYRLDDSFLKSLQSKTPVWCFKIVTQQQENATVQNYGIWSKDEFELSVEFGNTTTKVICNVTTKTIATTAALKALQCSKSAESIK